ncbi:unnamed protein product [Brassica rapa subsp. trilocularis]
MVKVLTSFPKEKTAMEVEEKAICLPLKRIRRKSKPGANRLFKQDRPPREIRSVFTALRN